MKSNVEESEQWDIAAETLTQFAESERATLAEEQALIYIFSLIKALCVQRDELNAKLRAKESDNGKK